MTFTPIAVYFLYFIFSHPDSQLCTPQNRIQDCSSAGYQPACAVYTGGDCHSSTGLCYKTLNTACQACIDDKVIGFTLGECEQPALPQFCSKNQRGHGCSGETGEAPACGYAQPLFRGKGLTAQQFSNNCEACRSEPFVFNVLGECQSRHTLGVCREHQTKDCEEEQAEPLCAYYTGDECPDKMCRKTMRNSCNVCQESSVLFFVKGECSDNIIPSDGIRAEDLIQYDTVDQSFPIKELAPVVQKDGSILYEEVKPEQKLENVGDCEPQENIPELEAVVQADGTILYEIAAPKVRATEPKEEKVIPELEPVVQEEAKPSEVQKEVFTPDCVIEVQENIPELAPVVQEDGSIVYEQVSSLNTVELAAEIPKLEAILQEDGTFTYKDLKEVQKVVESQENIPEFASLVQKEVFEPDCVIEVQENIPELASVVQEDGSILYEQVEPSKESANEETSIVPLNEESLMKVEEEKVEPVISTVSVEVIDTRLLTNEPAN